MTLSGKSIGKEQSAEPADSDESLLLRQLRTPATQDSAFRKLVELHKQLLYWQIRRIVGSHDDADDVLQNTFIKAWNGIHTFRGESRLKTWLFRIATNESITFIRSRSRKALSDLDGMEDTISHSNSQENPLSGDEIRAKLETAVESLPVKQKIVFCMKYYDELKYEEMAEILGGTVGSLKASFHHAVKKIEAMLSED